MTWYTGDPTYDTVLAAAFGLVALVVLAAPFLQSPYGRFASDSFGVNLSPRLGWFLMELPATLSFAYFFLTGPHRDQLVPGLFALMWIIHYGNRGWIFPYLIRSPKGAKASFSLMVVASGWLVTSLHGYLNGAFFSTYGTHYTTDWLTDPRFLIGLAIYYSGYAMNLHSDAILRNLRTKEEVERGEKVYRIPRGGLFRYVTNASYLTELWAWTGFAICTWSLGACFVLAISIANLVPRAFATHRWYLETFPDEYPRDRKVLIPGLL